MWKIIVEADRPHMTIIRRKNMRFAVTKARIQTHTDHV